MATEKKKNDMIVWDIETFDGKVYGTHLPDDIGEEDLNDYLKSRLLISTLGDLYLNPNSIKSISIHECNID